MVLYIILTFICNFQFRKFYIMHITHVIVLCTISFLSRPKTKKTGPTIFERSIYTCNKYVTLLQHLIRQNKDICLDHGHYMVMAVLLFNYIGHDVVCDLCINTILCFIIVGMQPLRYWI